MSKTVSRKFWKDLDLWVLIDWEFFFIDQMYFSIDQRGIENQSNEAEAKWWISSFFDQSSKRFDQSKAINFKFSLVFY